MGPANKYLDQESRFWGNHETNAVGFSIGNKGYIGTGGSEGGYNNEFWEWDQTTDVWTRKADFEGIARGSAVGFSIGNKGYIGSGNNSTGDDTIEDTYHKDFWEWDQATDTWTRIADFEGIARGWAVGFSIGNKGYIGTGRKVFPDSFRDFWEYDPLLTTGISELDNENSSIYPNPASDKITIHLNQQSNNEIMLKIYAVTGELVKSEILIQNHQQINLSDLRNGIFLIEVKSNYWSNKQKLIIQR